MRRLYFLFFPFVLAACGGPAAPGNETRNGPIAEAPAPAPADCLQGLPPGPPEAAAAAAAGRGDHRVYRYGQNGFAYQDYVAGYERCTGPGVELPRRPGETLEKSMQGDSLELGEIRDQSAPLNCVDCEYPLSQCGRIRIDYAVRYNRELFRRGGRGPAPSCPGPQN